MGVRGGGGLFLQIERRALQLRDAALAQGSAVGTPATSEVEITVDVSTPKRATRSKLKAPVMSPPARPSVPLHESDAAQPRNGCQPARRLSKRESEAEAAAQERRVAARLQALLDAHHELAQRAATESAVLLKNDPVGGAPLLPLAKGASVALVGGFAEAPRFQGAGSSKAREREETPRQQQEPSG